MKNCIIIHGGPLSDGYSETNNLHQKHWLPWAKEQFTALGIQTDTPEMPNPLNPIYTEWRDVLEHLPVTGDTILIGHSRGCAFLLRWLAESKQNVNKVIFVSPNLRTQSENPSTQSFYNFDLHSDTEKRLQELTIFSSDNEDSHQKWAKEKLQLLYKCVTIELQNRGHYITEDMSNNEFPELINAVLS